MRFSLQSFIRLTLLDTNFLISALQRKLTSSGGYDYYWTLGRAINSHILGKSEDEIHDILTSASNPTEQNYNRLAYENYKKKFGKKKDIATANLQKTKSYQNGEVSIQFTPNFTVTDSKGQHTYCIWANQTTKLTQSAGAMACYMLRDAYRNSKASNHQFYLVDLAADRTYSEKQISNTTSIAFQIDVGKVASILTRIDG
jgi:hypothetical protein